MFMTYNNSSEHHIVKNLKVILNFDKYLNQKNIKVKRQDILFFIGIINIQKQDLKRDR